MSIASEIQRIQTAKDDIVRALGRRGVVIPSGSTLDEFAEVIDPITSGKTIDWMDNPDNYLSFKFITDGSVRWQNAKGDIQYSKNGGSTWTYFNGTTVFCDAGDEIWFKGTLTGGCGANAETVSSKFYTVGKYYAYGNIQSLCSFDNTLADYHFAHLFYKCAGLNVSIEKTLLLPSTTLANNCYNSMFYGCASLATAPELPATTLASYCYYYMFYGCTSLATAPELPATTLADYCYSYMFQGCTNLNYIKCLATDISASNCLIGWVNGVSSTGVFIKDASMSLWTTGINGIPSNWTVQNIGFGLDKKSLGFYESGGTKQLTIISTNNPWTATTEDDWVSLSQSTGSTGETTISITASSTSTPRNNTMVSFNDGEKTIILFVVQNDKLITPLTFEIISAGTIYWKKAGSMTSIPLQYKKNNGALQTLSVNSSVSVAVGDIIEFYGLTNTYGYSTSYYHYFSGSSTTMFNVKGNIMSLLDKDNYFMLEKINANYAFINLFKSTKILDAGNLTMPAMTLMDYCYAQMFSVCTSLTTAPELPAHMLTSYCYQNMFYGCTNLNHIKCLATNILASNCTRNWVNGVAASGTFEKNPNMSSWTTGPNGIPSNWTVQDAVIN